MRRERNNSRQRRVSRLAGRFSRTIANGAAGVVPPTKCQRRLQVLRVVRLVRIFRIFKLGRRVRKIQVVTRAVSKSAEVCRSWRMLAPPSSTATDAALVQVLPPAGASSLQVAIRACHTWYLK